MCLIDFAGQKIEFSPSGALYWHEKNTLVVSDLHFEKGSHFAARGVFLPPHDTKETLDKLIRVCAHYKPRTILFLGDVFHDKNAIDRMSKDDQAFFRSILDRHEVIWVEGNHDQGLAPQNVEIFTHYNIAPIRFVHIANNDDKDFEMSGHYHPSVQFSHKGQKVRRPCFVVGARKLILPAFGSFTGGLDIKNAVYEEILGDKFANYALGHTDVYLIKPEKIIS